MKTAKQVLKDFNEKGVWPTDDELRGIAMLSDDLEDYMDVELELLRIAEGDTNHPYHSKTQPSAEVSELLKTLLS